jgi:hypothetical protein
MSGRTVGSAVRVDVGSTGKQRRRAVVEVVDEAAGTVDVLVDGEPVLLSGRPAAELGAAQQQAASESVRELRVALSSVRELEAFEASSALCEPSGARSQAQRLLQLGDARAARETVRRAAVALGGTASVGAVCVSFEGSYDETGRLPRAWLGMVCTLDDGVAELEVDGLTEVAVPAAGLVAVPPRAGDALAFSWLCTDAARLAMIQAPPAPQAALEACSAALATCQCLRLGEAQEHFEGAAAAPQGELADVLFEAHLLKARAHVLQSKLRAAAADVRAAVLLRPQDLRAREMVDVVKQRQAHEEATNRMLAKGVARWVDSAMRQNQERQVDSLGEQMEVCELGAGGQQAAASSQLTAQPRAPALDSASTGLVGWFTSSFLGDGSSGSGS